MNHHISTSVGPCGPVGGGRRPGRR